MTTGDLYNNSDQRQIRTENRIRTKDKIGPNLVTGPNCRITLQEAQSNCDIFCREGAEIKKLMIEHTANYSHRESHLWPKMTLIEILKNEFKSVALEKWV